MTRRDYCANCYEMVADDDVSCYMCSVSICHGCITHYDAQSFVCMMQSRLKCQESDPIISVNELREYYESLSHPDLRAELLKLFDQYDASKEDGPKELDKHLSEIKEIVDKYEQWPDSEAIHNIPHDDAMLISIKTMNVFLYEPLPFKCIMCHKGIEVCY